MAQLTSFDQLNSLSSTSIDETALKERIRDYFKEMDLPEDEKEQRIGFAEDLEVLFRNLFAMMLFATALGNDLDEKSDSFSDYAYVGMTDAMLDNGYSSDYSRSGLGYVEQYARSRCREIVDTAILHKVDEYYMSAEHSLSLALDETNAIANYDKEMKAIAQGYTMKTWVTFNDNKVRHSHQLADGQTINIFKPFHIGQSKMMFPMDRSLNASPREIYNCRCVLEYSGKDKTKDKIEFSIPKFSFDLSQIYLVYEFAKGLKNTIDSSRIKSIHKRYEIDFYVGENGKALPSKYKEWIGDSKRLELLKKAKDPRVVKLVSDLYRRGSFIGDGGTKDVLLFELATGLNVGIKSNHYIKVKESIRRTEKMLASGNYSDEDIEIIEKIRTDLIEAKRIYDTKSSEPL